MCTLVFRLVGIVSLVLIAMATFTLSVHAETRLELAAQHAINGPEVKKIKVMNHEFNIKKARVVRTDNSTTITGQISHHLSFRDDDQVYYTISKSNGRVTSIEIKIDRGGLAPYASQVAGKLLGVKILEEKIESTIRELGRSYDGNWESAADAIVATIALKYPDRSTGQSVTPAQRRPWGVQTAVNGGANVRDQRATRKAPIVRDQRSR
ncbi:hypothetical protein [Bythopirellula goksoeyrii]|uniref:TPM domain-containing protein n=1 Tax=Bythopirellula goksoeyrii TaxID=1400387 RepID=A0A5B9Q9X8_9BACT|nr:hypothetical protein [Bythopirellula goksoeyrii]QEG34242.1 hypothetical protein Pr1d_15160 [Bythopirellula goksoeyrii]